MIIVFITITLFISSTNYFLLLSLLGDHNENKAFLPVLCYPCHFFPLYIKKMLLFIFYIKYSFYDLFIHLFMCLFSFFFSFSFNKELAVLELFLLCDFCIFFLSVTKYNLLTYLHGDSDLYSHFFNANIL